MIIGEQKEQLQWAAVAVGSGRCGCSDSGCDEDACSLPPQCVLVPMSRYKVLIRSQYHTHPIEATPSRRGKRAGDLQKSNSCTLLVAEPFCLIWDEYARRRIKTRDIIHSYVNMRTSYDNRQATASRRVKTTEETGRDDDIVRRSSYIIHFLVHLGRY